MPHKEMVLGLTHKLIRNVRKACRRHTTEAQRTRRN